MCVAGGRGAEVKCEYHNIYIALDWPRSKSCLDLVLVRLIVYLGLLRPCRPHSSAWCVACARSDTLVYTLPASLPLTFVVFLKQRAQVRVRMFGFFAHRRRHRRGRLALLQPFNRFQGGGDGDRREFARRVFHLISSGLTRSTLLERVSKTLKVPS